MFCYTHFYTCSNYLTKKPHPFESVALFTSARCHPTAREWCSSALSQRVCICIKFRCRYRCTSINKTVCFKHFYRSRSKRMNEKRIRVITLTPCYLILILKLVETRFQNICSLNLILQVSSFSCEIHTFFCIFIFPILKVIIVSMVFW